MEKTTSDIATLVKGKLSGDGKIVVRGAAGISEATPHDITFFRDEKKRDLLATTKAAAVFVPHGYTYAGKTVIEVENPIEAYAIVLKQLADEKVPPRTGVSPMASVSKSARIGKNVFIGAFCIVEDNAEIGDNVSLMGQVYVGVKTSVGEGTYIYPQVVLREDVKIGARCILHPGVVIGADGYGYFPYKGKHNKIPQVGTVIVEDDVEIGAGTTIDRATTGATVIGRGTKIDNLVQVGHNVEIGEHSLLVAQVGIAGSCKIGKNATLGGQVGVADHITMVDGAMIGGQAGVIQNVDSTEILYGNPAQPIKEAMKQALLFRRLPELFKDVRELKGKKDSDGKSKNA